MSSKPKYLLKKVTKTNDQQNNMFMTQTLDQDEAQFYKDGKICSYYIVGNPDLFKKKSFILKQSEQSNIPSKPSQRVIQKHQRHNQDSDFIYEDMDASDVEKEVERVIQQQKQPEQGVKMALTKPDQIYAHRENKIMVAFEQQQQKWQQRVIQSAKACGRDPKQSLFHHIDAARQRYEDRKLLDLIQSDSEKYGNHLWEMQLRAAPGELNNKNEKAVFEIVRKNKAEQVYERPEGFKKRFEEKKDVIEKIIPNLSVKELEIVGQNKLIKESISMLNLAKNQKNVKFNNEIPLNSKRKIILSAPFEKKKQKEEPLYYQDVLEMNYNKRDLRQSGQLDIYKQIF
ncbi:unnamed protein product [Paramecium primaurelia]|uniref:Uncharacterized protein n=2 Tax=Paramecium TaxID=5884 RepID=A0A8S1SER4_9CILI|nr:unnamed protein product [Paramecium primaurelia]CAD8139611.1 unnamed protein product [Paramecium pentaurelia]